MYHVLDFVAFAASIGIGAGVGVRMAHYFPNPGNPEAFILGGSALLVAAVALYWSGLENKQPSARSGSLGEVGTSLAMFFGGASSDYDEDSDPSPAASVDQPVTPVAEPATPGDGKSA